MSTDTDTDNPDTAADNVDPAAKTRVVVGGILLALAWLLSAATVVGLLTVLPDHLVDDHAFAIIAGGLLVAAVATAAIVEDVMQA